MAKGFLLIYKLRKIYSKIQFIDCISLIRQPMTIS